MNEPDEFAGMGGSYALDKKGRRVLVQRTKEPAPLEGAQEPEPASALDAGISTTKEN